MARIDIRQLMTQADADKITARCKEFTRTCRNMHDTDGPVPRRGFLFCTTGRLAIS